jgi:hypothetical protein
MQDAVTAYAAYCETERQLNEAKEMLRESEGDVEMAEMVRGVSGGEAAWFGARPSSIPSPSPATPPLPP